MRLHRLEITAFGPFAGSHDIDLEALAHSGLFLIHGPTGAGKTSILDAVCFALYAAVPGARSGSRAGLRSDHAAADAVPEVRLELTASGRRFRVTRSPEFQRPKKRGTGFTKVQARVQLNELVAGEWVDRGSRHDEVGLVIHDVVGMGLEQFIKVVLLPQGDFAAFLRANPEERRAVLERLFDTSRFTDVEDWLSARRRALAADLSAARQELSTGLLRVDDTLARLEQAEDLEHAAWDTLPTADVAGVLAGLVAAVDARASAAIAAAELARGAQATAETALGDARRLLEHQQTAARARADLAALDAQREVCDEASRRLAEARRAAVVRAHLETVDHCRAEREAAVAAVAGRRAALTALAPTSALPDDAAAGQVRDLAAVVDQHAPALAELSALVRQAHQQHLSAQGHERLAAEQLARSRELAVERSAIRDELDAAAVVLAAAREEAATLAARVARQGALARVERLTADLQASERRLPALHQDLAAATGVALTAREHLVTLRERRLEGMAGELALGLSDGEPCPVCGACAHPAPARSTRTVTAEDLATAEVRVEAAARAQAQAQDALTAELATQRTRAESLEREDCDLGPDDLPAAIQAAAEQVALARAAVAAVPTTAAALDALSAREEELRSIVERAGRDHDAARALAQAAREQATSSLRRAATLLREHRAACPCAGGHPGESAQVQGEPGDAPGETLDEALDAEVAAAVLRQHTRFDEALALLGEALRDLATAERTAEDAAQRLEAALREQGFASVEEARAARLDGAELAILEDLLARTERCRAEAEALLGQPEVAAAQTRPAPDLDALTAAHERARAVLQEVSRRHTLTEQAEGELRRLATTIHAALDALGPAEAEHALVTELADCVTGTSANNALRMRLSSYILAARLEEVARLANERLARMSDGRYALEYSDALAARGARSGLGLRVRDSWTGQPRDTASLSGGEAFMASLALALGLGDAVRAEAGGFDLQTLFVDEGFGTLDEESLEQVMAVLDTLREGGRAVGIVSHVAELRQRIPVQLRVTKTPSGSRVSLSLDDEAAA